MYLANPWGLIGLLALPGILYIHFFRRRFPPRQIAGLFLWLSPRQESPSGRRRQKPPVTLSLILELLAALLATVLLSDPRMEAAGRFRHLVFVLDSSASMAARTTDGETSAERAVKFIGEELSQDGPSVRGTVILTGKRPVILGRTAAEAAEIASSLGSYRPGQAAHSAAEALGLALDLAAASGEVFFISDRLPAENQRHQRISYVAVGRAGGNVGFVGAQWRPSDLLAPDEIFIRVGNFSDEGRSVRLTGRAGAKVLLQKSIDIAAGAEQKVVWKPPGDVEQIHFDLEAQDSLETDNHIVLLRPARKFVTVVSLFSGGEEAEHIARAVGAMKDVSLLEDTGAAHLAIAPPDDSTSRGPESWRMLIGPLSGAYRGQGEPRHMVGPFLIERTHSLMEGVSLKGVIWAGAAPGGAGLIPIVSGGDRPLIAVVPSEPVKTYWLNLDLGRSNLARSPDWPILLSNLVELRRSELPGLGRRNFRLGEVVRYARSEPAASLAVSGPEGFHKDLPPSADFYLAGLSRPGLYRVALEGRVSEQFALNLLDQEESDLRALGEGTAEAKVLPRDLELSLGRRPAWMSFLLGGAILAAILGYWSLSFRSRDDI